MAGTSNSITTKNRLVGTLNSGDNLFSGLVNTAYNPAYALVTQAGAQITLFISSVDYKMYAQLKDKYGNTIFTSNVIDLPLETMVVNARYDSTTKEVVLILDNGNELRFSVADLVEGLVSTEQLDEILNDYVTFVDYAGTAKAGVIKTSDAYATTIANGVLTSQTKTYEQYESLNNDTFISKGTLENVISGKELVDAEDIEKYDEDLFGDYKVTGEGESVTLEDTVECPMEILLKPSELYQESTTGKNLLDGANPTGTNLTSVSMTNNIIKVSSTSTSTIPFARYVFENLQTGDTYRINGIVKSEGGRIALQTYSTVWNTVYYFDYTDGNTIGSHSYTVPSGTTAIRYLLYSNKTIPTGNSESSYENVIVTKNNSDMSYEPYTENQPSPSPDYPQDIHVVSGNNEIKIGNKNLFDKNNVTSGYYLSETGTNITDNTSFYSDYIYVYNKQVIVNVMGNWVGRYTCYYDKNKTFISSENSSAIRTNDNKFTIPNNAYFMKVSNTLVNLENLQIEYGTTTTDYVEHQEQSLPLNLGDLEYCKIGDYEDEFRKSTGKNLLNRETCTENAALVWTTGLTMSDTNSLTSDYIKVDDNETIRMKYFSQILFYTSDKTYIGALKSDGETIDKSGGGDFTAFTVPSGKDIAFVRLGIRSARNSNKDMKTENIMVNKGNTLLPYEPYEVGIWYLKKNIGKTILDGSENWVVWNIDNINTQRFYTNLSTNGASINSLCDKLFYEYGYADTEHYYLSSSTNAKFNQPIILINRNRLESIDVNGIKKYIASNNLTIYRVLEIPEYILLNDTLQQQLENIYYHINSYEDQTNVSQINNDLPFVLKLSAFKSTTNGKIEGANLQINNLNNDKEDKVNKVTELSSSSTDAQYPSAKAVYDIIGNVETLLEELDSGSGV